MCVHALCHTSNYAVNYVQEHMYILSISGNTSSNDQISFSKQKEK